MFCHTNDIAQRVCHDVQIGNIALRVARNIYASLAGPYAVGVYSSAATWNARTRVHTNLTVALTDRSSQLLQHGAWPLAYGGGFGIQYLV
jgi:hypothetical protein